jgi:hypothetical protein
MPRDMNKPQGKPYVYEPPVQKYREKMGNREKHQVRLHVSVFTFFFKIDVTVIL